MIATFVPVGEEALFLGTSDETSLISFASPIYFDLIDADNNMVASTQVIECSGHIFGSITIPSSNVTMGYRYRLRGTDIAGKSFSLILPMHAPVTIEEPDFEVSVVTASPVPVTKGAYSTVKYSFKNTKKGPDPLIINFEGTVAHPVTDIQYPDGQSVSLGPMETKEVSVSVQADSGVADDTTFNMALSATESCTNQTKTASFMGIVKSKYHKYINFMLTFQYYFSN